MPDQESFINEKRKCEEAKEVNSFPRFYSEALLLFMAHMETFPFAADISFSQIHCVSLCLLIK